MSKSLAELGVSQKAFAEYLGVWPETVSRWVNSKEPIPRYAEIILCGAVHANHLIMHIRQDFLIPPPLRDPPFDRNAYQREYMKDWRKRQKQKKNEKS